MKLFSINMVPEGGDDVAVCAQQLVTMAKFTNVQVVAYFNDTLMIAHPKDAPQDVIKRWQELRK